MSSPLAITATLRTPDDSIIQLPTTAREASTFAAPAGDIYRVDLPRELAFRVIAVDEPLTLTR